MTQRGADSNLHELSRHQPNFGNQRDGEALGWFNWLVALRSDSAVKRIERLNRIELMRRLKRR